MSAMAERAKAVAERTAGAYSFDRYTNWTACARVLLEVGYSDEAAAWILESKITRWAADGAERRYGRATSRNLRTYVQTNSALIARFLREDGVQ